MDQHRHISVLNGSKVHAVTKKTFILNEHLIVSWAGKLDAASKVLDVLRSSASKISNDTQFLEKYLEANCRQELSDVSLLVIAIDESGKISSWGNACKEIVTPSMTIWAAGTGYERLFQCLGDLSWQRLPNVPDAQQNVSITLQLAGALLGEEIRTGGTIERGFGGTYDIATF